MPSRPEIVAAILTSAETVAIRDFHCIWFLPARRSLAQVLAVVVCLSVCPSVCPSITSRCSTEAAKCTITQTTPNDSMCKDSAILKTVTNSIFSQKLSSASGGFALQTHHQGLYSWTPLSPRPHSCPLQMTFRRLWPHMISIRIYIMTMFLSHVSWR